MVSHSIAVVGPLLITLWLDIVMDNDLKSVVNYVRLLGFGACLLGAAVCFFVAFLTLPWLALKPGKFALAFRCVPSD